MPQNMLKVYSRCIKGNKKDIIEDNFFIDPEKGIFILADGMSGRDGVIGSYEATLILGSTLASSNPGENSIALLQDKVSKSNERVCGYSAGTTLDALILEGTTAHLAHLGDARVYGIDNCGTVTKLTQDHSWSALKAHAEQKPIEAYFFQDNYGPLYHLGLRNFAERRLNGISIPAISFAEILEQNTCSVPIEKYDFLFMATDGLMARATESEIQAGFKELYSRRDPNPDTVLHYFRRLIEEPQEMVSTYIDSVDEDVLEVLRKKTGVPKGDGVVEKVKQFAREHKPFRDEVVAENIKHDDTIMLLIDLKGYEKRSYDALIEYVRSIKEGKRLSNHAQHDLHNRLSGDERKLQLQVAAQNEQIAEAQRSYLELKAEKLQSERTLEATVATLEARCSELVQQVHTKHGHLTSEKNRSAHVEKANATMREYLRTRIEFYDNLQHSYDRLRTGTVSLAVLTAGTVISLLTHYYNLP